MNADFSSRRPAGQRAHVKGEASVPLWDLTIGDMLAKRAGEYPQREALISQHQNQRFTYAQLAQQVDRLAAGLLSLGLQKGDRLGIWSPNCSEWILCQFATARIGVILVNVNPAYRLGELEYALNQVQCRALVLATRYKSSDYVAMIGQLAPELRNMSAGEIALAKLPHLKHVILLGEKIGDFCGVQSFDALMQCGQAEHFAQLDECSRQLGADDAINIQFTSGTTGAPKCATLTHRNIVNNAYFVTGALKFTEQDRLCLPVPLYHCFGMVMGSLGCIAHGACMVLPSPVFDAGACLRALQDYQCTAVYGVAAMFVALLGQEVDDAAFAQLRTGIMAGGPCPAEIMAQVMERMNLREITIAYGMTETSPVSFQSDVDDSVERRLHTVGRIHPHVEVKLVDEQEETVGVGETGEIWTRGYSVMQGYWGDEETTRESITPDGWMRTGDLGEMDAEGYLAIVGRLKDMIIRGGENVYPREVEEFLYRHPGIEMVQVFGVPSQKYGEEVCAWVIVKDGQELNGEQVKDFCRQKITHFKIPSIVRIVDEFPMTVTGKPQKNVMRRMMCEEMGVSEDG